MKKRPTIDDVALKAGVSRQTVSRAINNMHGISETTRDRVLHIATELGYRPSRLAKGMAGSRSFTIGLIVRDITNPSYAAIVRGIQDVAQSRQYNVFIRNGDSDNQLELEAMRSLVAENVDGIISVGGILDEEVIYSFADEKLPVVLVHRQIEGPHISSILTDVRRATRTAIEYLFGVGHRAIGLITRFGDQKKINHVNGYLQAYAAHNMAPDPGWIHQGAKTLRGGHEGAMRLLLDHSELTALIAYNDLMAIGALRACVELNRPVPSSVAIFGFDDIELASYVSPTLSTIRFQGYDVGCRAMERLLEMIAQPTAIFPPTILDIELVIRESTSLN